MSRRVILSAVYTPPICQSADHILMVPRALIHVADQTRRTRTSEILWNGATEDAEESVHRLYQAMDPALYRKILLNLGSGGSWTQECGELMSHGFSFRWDAKSLPFSGPDVDPAAVWNPAEPGLVDAIYTFILMPGFRRRHYMLRQLPAISHVNP